MPRGSTNNPSPKASCEGQNLQKEAEQTSSVVRQWIFPVFILIHDQILVHRAQSDRTFPGIPLGGELIKPKINKNADFFAGTIYVAVI